MKINGKEFFLCSGGCNIYFSDKTIVWKRKYYKETKRYTTVGVCQSCAINYNKPCHKPPAYILRGEEEGKK